MVDGKSRNGANGTLPCLVAIGWTTLCLLALIITPFALFRAPTASAPPDYAADSSWDALPTLSDGADIIPGWCGVDGQRDAPIAAFYVHPTSYLMSGLDNGPLDDFLTNFISWSQLIQSANALNGVADIWAPRYRQASQAVQELDVRYNWRTSDAITAPATDAAMKLAYDDVAAAFERFLVTTSPRPIILASHSQGTMHLKRLIGSLAASNRTDVLNRVVVAYLIGNTVEASEVAPLSVCASATQTNCVVSWNSVLEGGGHEGCWPALPGCWHDKLLGGPGSAPICVNPLTWATDTQSAAASLATGAVPITAHLFLPHLLREQSGARCGSNGLLYVDAPSRHWGFPTFEATNASGAFVGRMHAYDIPLFWANLRANARVRAAAWSGGSAAVAALAPEACPGSFGGLLVHYIVALLCAYVVAVVLCFAIACPLRVMCRRRRSRKASESVAWADAIAEAVACACCCPCYYACVVGAQRRRRRVALAGGKRNSKARAAELSMSPVSA